MNNPKLFKNLAKLLVLCSQHPAYTILICLICYGSGMILMSVMPVKLVLPVFLVLSMVAYSISMLSIFLAVYVVSTSPLNRLGSQDKKGTHDYVAALAIGDQTLTISVILRRFFLGYVKVYRQSLGGKLYPLVLIFITFMFFVPVSESKDLDPAFLAVVKLLIAVLMVAQIILWFAVRDRARKHSEV